MVAVLQLASSTPVNRHVSSHIIGREGGGEGGGGEGGGGEGGGEGGGGEGGGGEGGGEGGSGLLAVLVLLRVIE